MQVKIKTIDKLPYISNKELKDFLTANAGKFVKVETKHLFNNQYNTKHFRLLDSYISEVKNDARKNKGACGFCGSLLTEPTTCKKYTKENPSIYMGKDIGNCEGYSKWFLPSNTFFLAHPKGLSEQEGNFDTVKIGTYKLSKVRDFYMLKNYRKNIRFKWDGTSFFVDNGIGPKKTLFLDVPYNVQTKVKEILK